MLAAAGKETRVAALILVALAAIFAWMEWKQAAYFGTVFYPVALCAFGLVAVLALFAPPPAKLGGPFRIAFLALAGIALWTLLSALWSDTPSAAFAYSERAFFYLALFVAGAWVTAMARERWEWGLAPVALAGAGVGAAATVVLATGSDATWYLQGDGTLRFPIGYRNADVAFFLICIWPLLGLAASERLAWPLRALSLAGATLLVDLCVLGQSRGSAPAAVLALLVFLALSRRRLRAGVVVGLAAVPMLPFLSPLLDVYRFNSAEAGVVPILHEAARSIGLSALLSLVLGAFAFGLVEPRLQLGEARTRALSWTLGVAVALVALLGAGLFVSRHGGPVGFVDQRLDEFRKVGYPNLKSQGIRFGANVGSNRHDFWRVAVDQGLDHPILGGGAGSFQLYYLRHRASPETPHDPHSLEAVIFSELGFPGLLLLITFVGAAAWAVVRSRRRELAAAGLVAAGAAAATQWIVHGSYDWFWQYAGITGLGVYMLGAAAAPGLEPARERLAAPLRWGTAVVLAALALLAVPFFLSESYEKRASELAADDPRGAIRDYERAGDLDPYSIEPPLRRGTLEASLGRPRAALAAFREASEREPENYAPYLFTAEVLASSDRRAALRALRRARELNPLDPVVRSLDRRLRREAAPPPKRR